MTEPTRQHRIHETSGSGCIDYESKTAVDVLAIAHNGNLSNGIMFPTREPSTTGKALDRKYVDDPGIDWEPLYEVTQIKGDGGDSPLPLARMTSSPTTRPGTSATSTSDRAQGRRHARRRVRAGSLEARAARRDEFGNESLQVRS